MQWVETAEAYLKKFGIYTRQMDFGDFLEILIIAFLLYYILVWMKNTRAWTLLKGLIVICIFLLAAHFLEMNTIMWMAKNILSFAVIALIVVLQPELRNALEALGKKNFLDSLGFSDVSRREHEIFSEKTINEIVKACVEMGKVRTGALIVIEQKESLREYERTGIEVDGIVTSQLLINIFEHNTPLHDGAVIVRGNRVTSATCYLPLSANLDLSKELGTRHRAGVGISEVTDSLTLIVSEETGKISVAYEGRLETNLNADSLKMRMQQILNKNREDETVKKRKWLGRSRQKYEKRIEITGREACFSGACLCALISGNQIDDPSDSTTFYNIPVTLKSTELLEKENKVYEVLDGTDSINVTVRAPRSVIKQMRSSDIVAEADMSRLTEVNTIAISIYAPNTEVTSITAKPDVMKLSVEEKASKWIRVQYNIVGDVADGYMVSKASPDQTLIEVSGPKSAVERISYAGIEIDVSGASADLSANVETVLYDSDGTLLELPSVTKNVSYVHMAVEVLAVKEVPIELNVMGVPEDGYLATVWQSAPLLR